MAKATEKTTTGTEADRLVAVGEISYRLAQLLNNARHILREGAEDADTAYLVADLLDGAGYMAERAAVVAGREPSVVGGADAWLLGHGIDDQINSLTMGARQ